MDNTRPLHSIGVMQAYSNQSIHPGPSPALLEFEYQATETEHKTWADCPIAVFSSSTIKMHRSIC